MLLLLLYSKLLFSSIWVFGWIKSSLLNWISKFPLPKGHFIISIWIGVSNLISFDNCSTPKPAVLYPDFVYTCKKNWNLCSNDNVSLIFNSSFSLIKTSDEDLSYLNECLFSADSLFGDEFDTIFILKWQFELYEAINLLMVIWTMFIFYLL